MGICNSTTNSKNNRGNEIVIDDNLNYEWSPEESLTAKDNITKNSFYKIKSDLFDFISDKNSKMRKQKRFLVLKYLFIDQYGKIFTQIPRKESKEIIKIEGSLDRKGLLRLKKTEEKIEAIQITNYEGNISRKITHLQIEGFADISNSKNEENTLNEKFPFCVDFTKNEWVMEFIHNSKKHFINCYLELNDNDNHISAISGISFEEEKGVSIWKGIENEKRDITLTQQYIEDAKTVSDDLKKIFYQGKIDRITNSIEGIIQGKDMDGIKFKISFKKKK